MTTAISDSGLQFADSSVLVNAPVSSFANLQASATGSSANVTVTADAVALFSSANSYYNARSVSLTINTASSGANGLDTGSLAASTWYSVWVIYNGSTVAGLVSTSASSPTMPSGYTFKARVGWVRTDSTGNKYPLSFKQYGRRVQYALVASSNMTALPQMASGASGSVTTPTFTSIATATYIPSTAAEITLVVGTTASGNLAVCGPNSAYGASNGSNPPPVCGGYNASTTTQTSGSFSIESTNVYWAATGSGYVNCLGWVDNL